MNLRAQDVPGYSVKHEARKHSELHLKAFEDGAFLRTCLGGAKGSKPVFEARSRTFQRGGALPQNSLTSSVEIEKTAAVARREVSTITRALSSARDRSCLTRRFDALGSQAGVMHVRGATVRVRLGHLRVVPLNVGSVASAADGGTGLSLGMVVTYEATRGGRRVTVPVPFQLDALAALTGRAEVTITGFAFGEECPAELEAKLFSLLVTRSIAASHAYPATRRA